MLQHRHQARYRERKKIILGANHDEEGEEQRLRNMANSETNPASNLVDVHVSGAFQLHAVFLHTVTSIDRLFLKKRNSKNMSVCINKTRNDTTTYSNEKTSVQAYPSRQFPVRTLHS